MGIRMENLRFGGDFGLEAVTSPVNTQSARVTSWSKVGATTLVARAAGGENAATAQTSTRRRRKMKSL